jgi:hypothetical protein
MTSRQARKQRREQERKANKAARKTALNIPAPPLALEHEFPPEPIARARATRERIQQRAAMNRANALHSTGPRSPEGKSASSRNSLKHGLASGQLMMPGEDPAAFEALVQDLLEEHQPAHATEELLIHQMAQSWWLAQRALGLQNDCFTASGIDEKRLALFLRYHATHQRAFHKALSTLIRMQKDRRCAANGFVSQKHASAAPHVGFVSQPTTMATNPPGFVSQHRTASHYPSTDPLLQSAEKEVPSSHAA